MSQGFRYSNRSAAYLLLSFFLLSACGQQGGSGSGGGMTPVGVTMKIPSGTAASTAPAGLQPQQTVPGSVASVSVSVTAGGTLLTSTTVVVTPGEIVTISLEVPSGPARIFIAEARDAEGSLLFRGQSEPVDLVPGVPTTVTIQMLPISPIFVDGEGTDGPDCGTQNSPCRTITQGLNQAVAGQTVLVAAGTYFFGVEGEPVPLTMKPGVDILGQTDDATTTLDFSNASFGPDPGIVGADNATLSGFEIFGSEGSVESLIEIVDTAPTIQGNVFYDLSGCCTIGIRVGGTGAPIITGNTFGQTELGLDTAILVEDNAAPVITGNVITGTLDNPSRAVLPA